MAKLKSEVLSFNGVERNEFSIKFDINVNKDGSFATTLPSDIVKLFKDSKIDLNSNKLGNPGYFCSNTCEGLIAQVKAVGLEYMSCELLEEKIVIHYCIQTRCSYAIDKDGEVIPNPGSNWSGVPNKWENHSEVRYANWRQGNVEINSTRNSAFGFLIYAEPFVKRSYKFKSGKIKTEHISLSRSGKIGENALKKGYFLNWLNDVPCMKCPDEGKIEVLDYNENICEFFVSMIKSIAMMNEKIKDFLKPDQIKLIADQKVKLLG